MASDELQRFMDELRARIPIADVVGAKVKLVKKGREYQGLCPFHNEKTPSFTINEAKGFYHCFGCGAHGDIIRFEMEANGLPFMDALQKLAHQAGMQMPHFSKEAKEEAEARKSLYEIMEVAAQYFERELRMPDGAEGYKYFTEKRLLSKEILQKFRLGYAPNNNGLMAHLKAQGIDEKDLQELGLIAIPEDKSRKPHDFFRNRVMIPITNKQGKIIAFGGRVMEKIEPKYLNSPDTPIFNKRRNLYNLDKAREVAYKEKKLIICEGYMDVIALDKFGFGYAVAPLGTALTEEQIMEAWKVCNEPIICLDGDNAGIKAAMRAVDRVLPILRAGYSLKFLFLPDKMDPDEYLQAHGATSFAALLTKTKPLIDILWQKYTENEDSSTPEKKALIERTLLDEVNKIGDGTVRNYYEREIKNRIYTTYKQSAWKNPATNNAIAQSLNQPIKRPVLNHNYNAERPQIENENDKMIRFIMAAELIYPELIDDYEEQIYLDEIKNEKLRLLQTTIADTFHEQEAAISGDELTELVLNTNAGAILKTLWEKDMLKKQAPFINDLRHDIEKLLQEEKRRSIEADIKKLTEKVSAHFDEEVYMELMALKKTRDEMLIKAENFGV
jgi:DNA primase